jgi:Lipoprotein LpqB beta-propeller domain
VPVDVPGISGKRVKDFLVSRDGTRLVAVVQGKRADSLRMSRIRYLPSGRLLSVTRSRNVEWSQGDVQRIHDIGWYSPTSVAVLNQLTRSYARVVPVPVDGSAPWEQRLAQNSRALAVVASPAPGEPLYTRTPEGLLDPTGAQGDTKPLPAGVVVHYAG